MSWSEYVTITVNRNLSNCEKARKKGFRGFNGIRTRGLCVSAAVLYQPELRRPIHWRPANLLSSSTRERNETQNEMMWTAGIQMKWVCDHRSESQFKQLRKSPKKRISGLQRDSNPWPLRSRCNALLAWAMKTHTLAIAIDWDGHIITSLVFPQFTSFHSVLNVLLPPPWWRLVHFSLPPIICQYLVTCIYVHVLRSPPTSNMDITQVT